MGEVPLYGCGAAELLGEARGEETAYCGESGPR